jgi:hypothetical protein
MLNKFLCVILLGALATTSPAFAQTAATAPAKVKGRIVAARVQGHVNAISKVNGQSRLLHDGDQLTDQMEVVTSPGANIILLFSNGATVNVAADSTLDIEEFLQDPFAGDQKVSEMTAEQGTSTTRLSLTKGELVGKVVHLNVDRGSEFTVQTPVGAAGIRGTTFRIVFRPAPGGKAFFVVTTADGTVVFRGVTSGPVSIPAGKQVVATFDYTPPSGGNPGNATQTTPVTLVTSDVPPAESAQIQVASQAIETATINLVIPPTNSTTNGQTSGTNNNPNTTNTPPEPSNPLPQTTPTAGLPGS